MIKKTRLSFSAISVDNKKTPAHPHESSGANTEHKVPFVRATHSTPRIENKSPGETTDRKKTIKSSTYQYNKKKFGRGGRSNSFGSKNQFKSEIKTSANKIKIPPPESGVIRIIPLGGVEKT